MKLKWEMIVGGIERANGVGGFIYQNWNGRYQIMHPFIGTSSGTMPTWIEATFYCEQHNHTMTMLREGKSDAEMLSREGVYLRSSSLKKSFEETFAIKLEEVPYGRT